MKHEENYFTFIQSRHPWLQHTFYIFLKFAQKKHQRHPNELHLIWWLCSSRCPHLLKSSFFKGRFYFMNSKNSADTRLDEKGEWLISTMPWFARNGFIILVAWTCTWDCVQQSLCRFSSSAISMKNLANCLLVNVQWIVNFKVIQQSLATSLWTNVIVAGFEVIDSCLLLGSSLRPSHPSLNLETKAG
jgi:hypothetical protein